MRFAPAAIALVFLTACPDDPSEVADGGTAALADAAEVSDSGVPPDAGLPPPEMVCPLPQTDVVLGDFNGDGVVDAADPIALQNHVFRGGMGPVCRKAADVTVDNLIENDDALETLSYLVTGTGEIGELNPNDCSELESWPEGQCAPLGLQIIAPAKVTDGRFYAQVAIRSPSLAVQGWSFSVRAENCSISDVSTFGTIAAETFDEPPGLRSFGYSASVAVEGGAIAYLTLSFAEDVFLPAGDSAVLSLEVSTPLPEAGCQTCTLRVADDLAWFGPPLAVVVVADGYSYRPAAPSTSIEICAD